MTQILQTALILVTLLLLKHLFADFFLQTRRMMRDRGVYLHFGRGQHAVLHGGLSLICLLLVGAPLLFTLVLCVVEVVLHYHIDWAKGRHSDITGFGTKDAGYWRAFGVDQFLHQMTYVAMVWAWVVWAT